MDPLGSAIPYAELPAIQRPLDAELNWLREQPRVHRSLGDMEPGDAEPERKATSTELDDLLRGTTTGLPSPFRTFISDPEPRMRVRSATFSCLDLAEFAVDVEGGGSLIHFLSDQQWILHWLLYAGPAGAEAVVVTETPLGFELDEKRFSRLDPASGDATVCAESLSTSRR